MNNWTREAIKSHAKLFLKSNYWTAFAVCLIAMILGASVRSFELIGRLGDSNAHEASNLILQFDSSIGQFGRFSFGPFENIFRGFWGLLSFGLGIFVILLRIVVGNNLRVGQARYFRNAIGGDNKFDYLFSTFARGEWMSMSLKLLYLDFIIFLWGLLLVIPGIVKSYQYKFVPYILAEHPDYSIQQAMNISTKMTDDDKMNLFVLDLSFIGWYLLGSLLFGFGQLFVEPYPRATEATLYRLKVEALRYVGETQFL